MFRRTRGSVTRSPDSALGGLEGKKRGQPGRSPTAPSGLRVKFGWEVHGLAGSLIGGHGFLGDLDDAIVRDDELRVVSRYHVLGGLQEVVVVGDDILKCR